MTGTNLYTHPQKRTVLHPPHVNKTPFTRDYASVDATGTSVPHAGNKQLSTVNRIVDSHNSKQQSSAEQLSQWQKVFKKIRWATASAAVVVVGGTVAHGGSFTKQTAVETVRLTAFLFVGDMILPSVFEN